MRNLTSLGILASMSLSLVAVPAFAQDSAPDPAPNIRELETRAFEFDLTVAMPATREEVWQALTGDVSGWWDHHVSDASAELVIYPRPGGAFWEYFDSDGATGIEHAEVIFSRPPEKLVMTGPFGFSGNAVRMVVTYALEPVADENLTGDLDTTGSVLTVTVSVSGVYKDGWDSDIRDVWRHSVESRLKGYLDAGCRGGGRCEDFE